MGARKGESHKGVGVYEVCYHSLKCFWTAQIILWRLLQGVSRPYAHCANVYTKEAHRPEAKTITKKKHSQNMDCPNCGNDTLTEPHSKTLRCSDCGHTMPKEYAIIKDNTTDTIREIACQGPVSAQSEDLSKGERAFLDYVSAEGFGTFPKPMSVYYLPGQERAAISIFIRENRDYVGALTQNPQQLREQFSGWEKEMLVEQWLWCYEMS